MTDTGDGAQKHVLLFDFFFYSQYDIINTDLLINYGVYFILMCNWYYITLFKNYINYY